MAADFLEAKRTKRNNGHKLGLSETEREIANNKAEIVYAPTRIQKEHDQDISRIKSENENLIRLSANLEKIVTEKDLISKQNKEIIQNQEILINNGKDEAEKLSSQLEMTTENLSQSKATIDNQSLELGNLKSNILEYNQRFQAASKEASLSEDKVVELEHELSDTKVLFESNVNKMENIMRGLGYSSFEFNNIDELNKRIGLNEKSNNKILNDNKVLGWYNSSRDSKEINRKTTDNKDENTADESSN